MKLEVIKTLSGGLGVVLLLSCSPKQKEEVSDIIPVKTVEISSVYQADTRTYVGTVEESCGSLLSFATLGTVAQVLVDEGQSVHQGQVLAVLDKATMMNAYQISKATLGQAQDAFRRMNALYKKGSLPEIKFIEIQTQLAQAQASERIARKNLRDCVLRAPFSGYISKKMVDPGNNVAPGIGCFKLVKIERVKVKVSIPEKEISSIHLGQNITFKVDALNGRHFTGKVLEKGVQANVFSHTYDVKLQLINNGHMLLPGMVCSVYINNQGNGSAVIIPQEAIMIDGNNTFVWVVKKGGATKRIVKTGGVSDQGTVILDGLESGDVVIVSGQNKVSEGSKIKMV